MNEKNMESLEKKEPISLLEMWKNSLLGSDTYALRCSIQRGHKRERGRGARAAPRKKNCVRSDINQKN